MNITHAKVNWHLGYGNSPTLQIQVDKLPDFREVDHIVPKDKIIYAEVDGIVHFIAMGNGVVVQDPNTKMYGGYGFGGAHFKFPIGNGEFIECNNAWSSRAECVELPCMDVTVYESEGKYPDMGCGGLGLVKDKFHTILDQLMLHYVNGQISTLGHTQCKASLEMDWTTVSV